MFKNIWNTYKGKLRTTFYFNANQRTAIPSSRQKKNKFNQVILITGLYYFRGENMYKNGIDKIGYFSFFIINIVCLFVFKTKMYVSLWVCLLICVLNPLLFQFVCNGRKNVYCINYTNTWQRFTWSFTLFTVLCRASLSNAELNLIIYEQRLNNKANVYELAFV